MSCILAIGQSDSCGGSGIQADAKTAMCFGVHAATVATAVSVQSTKQTKEIHILPDSVVQGQMKVVLDDMHPVVIKTGMLASVGIIDMLGDYLDKAVDKNRIKVVVDPVITNRLGTNFLDKKGEDALKRRLLIHADLLTPNMREAEALTGHRIKDIDDAKHVAEMLLTLGPRHVILKGGEIAGETLQEIVADNNTIDVVEFPVLDAKSTYGAGPTLATGIAACLARGMTVRDAYALVHDFVTASIANAQDVGEGFHPVFQGHFFKPYQAMKKAA